MIGLALEGGGAKGAFHIGVMKAFKENGYVFDGVVGTSIGAYNAAMWVQDDFDALYALWMNMQPADLFDVENEYMSQLKNKHLSKDVIRYFGGQMRVAIRNKGIDVSRIKNFVNTTIDEEKIRASGIDFGLVTVVVPHFKPVKLYKDKIPQHTLTEYIMASANYPGFKIDPIESQYYMDGGLHENCPISLLIEKGYDEIIAVRTGQKVTKYRTKDKPVKIIDIIPSEDLGGTFIFDNALIRRNIMMGYYDALRMIKGLAGRNYYIETAKESLFFEALCAVSEVEVLQLAELFGVEGEDYRRVLFEGIIPRMARQLKIGRNESYQRIILLLLEEVAQLYGLNKWHIYTLEQFIEAIEVRRGRQEVAERNKALVEVAHGVIQKLQQCLGEKR